MWASADARALSEQLFDVQSAPENGDPASSPVQAELVIIYLDGSGERTERRITPHSIQEAGDGDFSIDAFCHLRGEGRTFLVSRIVEMSAAETGEIFDPPALFLVRHAGISEIKIEKFLKQEWRKAVTILLCRIAEVFPLPNDPDHMASIIWGIGKKIPGSIGGWHIHNAGVGVSDAELKQALYDAALLSPEWRTILADALGNFARGDGDWAADHPRRAYARLLRGLLRPSKRPRAVTAPPMGLFKGDGTV